MKSSLESGEPCVRHRCVKCCIETEMPLTEEDIRRISGLGYKVEEFSVRDGKKFRLKNKFGRCVFLTDEGCKIYAFRPEGCRLYPLVFDDSLKKPVLDELCPYREEFDIKKSDLERLLRLIEKLET